MTVVIFLLVLIVLIVVHEFGHLLAAKWFGMRVDEFGIGYPPRAATFAHWKGTAFTLNWLPFGGFVRIFGEDESGGTPPPDSFGAKPHYQQALVLVAGIFMNLAFAWVLVSTALALGAPRPLSDEEASRATEAYLVVSHVLAGSPAEVAGVRAGDEIVRITRGTEVFEEASASGFTAFVTENSVDEPLSLLIKRNGEEKELNATPAIGVLPEDPGRVALGLGVGPVGVLAVPVLEAPGAGLTATWNLTKSIAAALIAFFAGIFTFSADLSQVSGPLGIAGAVGSASAEGVIALMTITALISINLALINLLPVPALDGGRLLFVLIEWVIRRPLPSKAVHAVNAAGFAFLILLMLVITAHDLFKVAGA